MKQGSIKSLLFAACATFLLQASPIAHSFNPDSEDMLQYYQEEADARKSADDLVREAQGLLANERPLDARTKLLKALNKEPKNYKPHMLLGGYYMIHVGHFRLALSYLKQAERLFEATNGKPPYEDILLKDDHARILYLLAETKLNLDNYRGALAALDAYATYYSGGWYPGSRAWVLMKLGRVEEATRIARLGILMGSEPGRTLNILGILLSMQNQRQESLAVFNEAITYEYALGSVGQPATPLNNSGEVYREIFEEDKAEGSWLKAVALPDGCEHVLPSLNLSNLYIEQLKFDRATWAIINFIDCNRQFPLRNGEEHRALVHMARGRIALHTGNIDEALSHLEAATERQQWFGKIGTNPNDLKAATTISLAQALKASNNYLDLKITKTPWEWLAIQRQKVANSIRSWWLKRRALQVLSEDLNDFEDLYVRSTDSMLEYHTLGDVLESIPPNTLAERTKRRTITDNRPGAKAYYKAYLGQNNLAHSNRAEGLKLIDEALSESREKEDAGLRAQLLGLKLQHSKQGSKEYARLAEELFNLAPAELINKELKLPVNLELLDNDTAKLLESNVFISSPGASFVVSKSEKDSKIILSLTSANSTNTRQGIGANIEEAYQEFLSAVFKEKV